MTIARPRPLAACAALVGAVLGLAPTGCTPATTDCSTTTPDKTVTTAAPADSCEPFDPAAVTAVIEAQRQAWNRGDLDAFLEGYEQSDALLFTSGAKIRQGYDETRQKYRERYGESRETMGQLDFEILDVRGLGSCPAAAVVLGRWHLTETPEAGEGVFTLILERQDGGWRIVHDHTSAASTD